VMHAEAGAAEVVLGSGSAAETFESSQVLSRCPSWPLLGYQELKIPRRALSSTPQGPSS
jgi:hypothetical protein